MTDRKGNRAEEERLREEEEERRAGQHGSRYTGDGHPSPARRHSHRTPGRPVLPPSGVAATASVLSGESSLIEPHPQVGGYAPPMAPQPPPAVGGAPPVPIPVPMTLGRSRSGSRSRHDGSGSVAMPPMPADAAMESGSEAYYSSGGRPVRRTSSSRRRDGAAAAAAAVATASRLAAHEERERRRTDGSSSRGTPPAKPVSVKVRVHDDRDRNVTLRRLTDEEAAASRRDQRRRRADSVSSMSGSDVAGGRRYRREASQQRSEGPAESEPLEPLTPPNPAFAAGRRPKDSAYYSGQPGPSGSTPAAGATVSSLGGSPGSFGTMSPSPSGPLKEATGSAADRRRRRRLERRDGSGTGTVDYN
jgi:hypothetical protein